jgi:tRNA(Ile)-lysidine synthase
MFHINYTGSKNLLAFSAGVDSTALFFLLVEQNIPFDIAIVNYNQRSQAKQEIKYAQNLANKYQKKCFVKDIEPNIEFSEHKARDLRYAFFDQLVEEYDYDLLYTAHQLNDKLEWFFMQLTRGAGLNELLGLQEKSKRKNYTLCKPILQYSKQTLQDYLDKKKILYFEDHTNNDETILRNYFRHNYSNSLIEKYEAQIQNSFQYLQNDLDSLLHNTSNTKYHDLHIYEFNGDLNIAIKLIDKDLKEKGILLSKKTRDEILSTLQIVVSHKYAISIENNTIFIAPFVKSSMDKKFKENCRIRKIPPNIRGYLYSLEDFTFSSWERLVSLDTF